MAEEPSTDQKEPRSFTGVCPSKEEQEDAQELRIRYLEQQRRMSCRGCGEEEEIF